MKAFESLHNEALNRVIDTDLMNEIFLCLLAWKIPTSKLRYLSKYYFICVYVYRAIGFMSQIWQNRHIGIKSQASSRIMMCSDGRKNLRMPRHR